jgi:hypothetical protein
MVRFRLAAVGTLAFVLAAGSLMGQDSKNSDDSQSSTSKAKLPTHFSKLGLTEDQKQKVIRVRSSYKSKIDSLQEQINQLRGEERTELSKILSDTQKIRLRELLTHEADTKTDTKKDEKK